MNTKQKKEKIWMNVDSALQRLSWRFGNGSFTPNHNDINALNGLIQWVNDQRKLTIRDNQLFAKLYIYFFNRYLDEHKSTVFDKVPQIELSRLLDKPLGFFYESFTQSLNDNSDYQVFKKNGISLKHRQLKSDEELEQEKVKLKNMSKDDLNKIKHGAWTLEEVKEQLNKMITEALNRFQ